MSTALAASNVRRYVRYFHLNRHMHRLVKRGPLRLVSITVTGCKSPSGRVGSCINSTPGGACDSGAGPDTGSQQSAVTGSDGAIVRLRTAGERSPALRRANFPVLSALGDARCGIVGLSSELSAEKFDAAGTAALCPKRRACLGANFVNKSLHFPKATSGMQPS